MSVQEGNDGSFLVTSVKVLPGRGWRDADPDAVVL
jgi:hypothetical protein